MTTFGKEIKKARAMLGIKQKDLEALTGIKQKYLSRIETDKADPGLRIVLRIARVLHINMQLLVEQEQQEAG